MVDDNVQHGIDDNPEGDAEKGAALGGLGGAVVGAAAGSMMGPAGTVVGAVVGGLAGAGASGAAVSAVDDRDNDNNITGVGDGVTPDVDNTVVDNTTYDNTPGTYATNATTTGFGTTPMAATPVSSNPDYRTTGAADNAMNTANADLPGNRMPGIQTGGTDYDGTPDTRGITEKAADAVTGDRIDDKTGKPV